MVETGFTRAKNAGNIIMKNLMDFCLGTIAFVLLGFGPMLGEVIHSSDLSVCPNLDVSYSAFSLSTDAQSSHSNSKYSALPQRQRIARQAAAAQMRTVHQSTVVLHHSVISLVVDPVEAHRDLGRRLARTARLR
ncbi:MAG: hypothetical protein ACLTZI_01385 [[Eubacterium] siraeum]